MTANQRTIDRLRSSETTTVFVMRRIETPDGPMHVREPVVLEPFCHDCGRSIIKCRCQSADA